METDTHSIEPLNIWQQQAPFVLKTNGIAPLRSSTLCKRMRINSTEKLVSTQDTSRVIILHWCFVCVCVHACINTSILSCNAVHFLLVFPFCVYSVCARYARGTQHTVVLKQLFLALCPRAKGLGLTPLCQRWLTHYHVTAHTYTHSHILLQRTHTGEHRTQTLTIHISKSKECNTIMQCKIPSLHKNRHISSVALCT